MIERAPARGRATGPAATPRRTSSRSRSGSRSTASPSQRRRWIDALERVRDAAATLPASAEFLRSDDRRSRWSCSATRRSTSPCSRSGLGGRLDATNVVTPVGVAITAIDFDHEAYLGNTLEEIAAEKAGVIKRGTFAVLGANPPDGAARWCGAWRRRRAPGSSTRPPASRPTSS